MVTEIKAANQRSRKLTPSDKDIFTALHDEIWRYHNKTDVGTTFRWAALRNSLAPMLRGDRIRAALLIRRYRQNGLLFRFGARYAFSQDHATNGHSCRVCAIDEYRLAKRRGELLPVEVVA